MISPPLNRTTTRDGYVFIGGIERGMIFWGAVESAEHRDMEHYHSWTNPCPWIVLSENIVHRKLPIAIVVPLTSKVDKASGVFREYRIRVPSDAVERFTVTLPDVAMPDGDSLVLSEQIRVFAHDRLIGNPVARVPIAILAGIEAGVKTVLGFA